MNRRQAVSPIEPGLIVLHSNRMEVLRDGLVQWLAGHPLDPLETDIITVQSNGIAQWLRSTLARSGHDGAPGIAAALDTPMPSRLMWTLYRRVLGESDVPESSPLDEQPLTWRLMRLLGGISGREVYLPLQRFLEDDADLRKRYQLAQRLADLFDQYQVYRADWLADWQAGHDQLRGQGAPRPLEADQCWQAALWRDILADVGPQGAAVGRAGVHARFVDTLRHWPPSRERPDLPRRIVVFGVSSLPRQSLEALIEAARWTQVLVCVHNPCEYHWADIVEGRALLRSVKRHQEARPGRPPELDEDSLHAHSHPLLASWGRQGRDYIALLEELEDESGARGSEAGKAATASAAAPTAGPVPFMVAPAFAEVEEDSMLGRLQDDIRGLRSLPEAREEGRVAAPEDASIHFHVAHSALREVEILHDQLLAAFDADATLQPNDVIVMVPDIEQYAPYIEAVFGLHGPEDRRRIPYFIVDRGPARVNTVADAVERLLALPLARMGVGEVLDLLDIAAVRRRYGLGEEDIAVLRDWIQSANVRWGLDSGHRRALGLPIVPELAEIHTWSFGLRRMLLGYATGDGDDWNGIAPHGDVSGLDAGLVGTLALVLERLLHHARELAEPASPGQWAERLRALLDDFLLAPDDVAAYTIEQLLQALDVWLEECEDSGFDEPLTLQVVGGRWLASLQGAGMAQRFTSGAVTFATLMPMRAIPFRHVCLMGMNDGDYPRPRIPAHFDLMEKDYRPGDRSRRDDDRYLFLEALLSARERFYLSWVGRSIVDNTERPPSVLVGQLRDHLAAVWRAHEGAGLLGQITTEHPLQAFSPRYFQDASPQAGLFTYGREWRSREHAGDEMPDDASQALEALARDEPLSFSELKAFLEHPVREFFKQRLQVRYEDGEALDDEETFVADGLDNWLLHNALIQAARKPLEAGLDPWGACEAELARMRRSGELAFGGAGRLQVERGRDLLRPVLDEYRQVLAAWPVAVDESLELRRSCAGTPGLSGWLHGLRGDGDGGLLRLEMQATQLTSGKNRQWRDEKLAGYWVQHLAANSMGVPMTSLVLSPAGTARFQPIERAQAAVWLDTLLRAWAEGMRRPLPIKAEFARPVLTAVTLDARGAADGDAWRGPPAFDKLMSQVGACYDSSWNQPGRRDALYESRAYPTLEALFADGELVRWALALYAPLFIALRNKEAE